MSVLVFRVCKVPEGWVVESGERFGPFVSRDQAADLAEGMAAAIRNSGGEAEVRFEE